MAREMGSTVNKVPLCQYCLKCQQYCRVIVRKILMTSPQKTQTIKPNLWLESTDQWSSEKDDLRLRWRWTQGIPLTGGGGLVRVPNLRVCQHLRDMEWHTQGRKGDLTSCRGTAQLAWQIPPMRRTRRKNQAVRKGKWSPRGEATAPTYPGPNSCRFYSGRRGAPG